jgi:hypothetical protein
VNESFLPERGESEWVSSWRLEDVLANTDRFTAEVAGFLGLDPAALDRSVFERRVHGYPGGKRGALQTFDELEPDLRALLDEPGLRTVATAYSYELGETVSRSARRRLTLRRRG